MRYYANIAQGGFREDYSKRLMWKGEQIVAISGENKTLCRIIDVDEECRLEVELENGEHKLISSGEISIRKAK
jgi:biotin-(acetyl-CoA carboxylase) ligase